MGSRSTFMRGSRRESDLIGVESAKLKSRFLLYIDLLGFSEIVRTRPQVIPELFRVLDRSNAHKHGDFGVVQFSDTVLIYSRPDKYSDKDKRYCTMYLCEFAQEIQYMLLGRNAFIRALITYGPFADTGPTPSSGYKHIRAFWGNALVRAYQAEKGIQAVGLFVDKTVKPFMDIFQTHHYDKKSGIWFADTATSLRGMFFEGSDFCYAEAAIPASGTEALVAYDLFYLRQLFRHAHDGSLSPSVRNKYLTTWEFYRQKYSGLTVALEQANFDFDKVIKIGWKRWTRRIGTPRGYFG